MILYQSVAPVRVRGIALLSGMRPARSQGWFRGGWQVDATVSPIDACTAAR